MSLIDDNIEVITRLVGNKCKIKILDNLEGRIVKIEVGIFGTLIGVRYVIDDCIVEEAFFIDELGY